jgi:hypothetical protein
MIDSPLKRFSMIGIAIGGVFPPSAAGLDAAERFAALGLYAAGPAAPAEPFGALRGTVHIATGLAGSVRIGTDAAADVEVCTGLAGLLPIGGGS